MNGVQDKAPTWKEWIAIGIILPPALLGAMTLLGLVIDIAAQHSEQHDRCLKQATNGYEIRACR